MADNVTREIKNQAGNVIGSLSLPAETTEEQWQQALADFLLDPSQIDLTAMVKAAVSSSVLALFSGLIEGMTRQISAGIISKGLVSLGDPE